MNVRDLIVKITDCPYHFTDPDTYNRAAAAFLANLSEALHIIFPDECVTAEKPSEMVLFYCGVLVGYGKPIPMEKVREAHLAIILPGNRAIVSRFLYGPGNVTKWGTPASYHTT